MPSAASPGTPTCRTLSPPRHTPGLASKQARKRRQVGEYHTQHSRGPARSPASLPARLHACLPSARPHVCLPVCPPACPPAQHARLPARPPAHPPACPALVAGWLAASSPASHRVRRARSLRAEHRNHSVGAGAWWVGGSAKILQMCRSPGFRKWSAASLPSPLPVPCPLSLLSPVLSPLSPPHWGPPRLSHHIPPPLRPPGRPARRARPTLRRISGAPLRP